MDKKTKKGFSLIELIVVLAIISILTLIIVMAWNSYIYQSKIKTANSSAKVIFNAAQAECIKQESIERLQDDADKYIGSGEFYFYWDGSSASSGDDETALSSHGKDEAFARVINNIADDGVYKIFVENYTVQSVVYSPEDTSRYLGSYPVRLEEIVDIATPKPANVTMSDYVLP